MNRSYSDKARALSFILLAIFSLTWQTGHAQDVPKKAQKYFNEANYDIGLEQFETAKEKLLLAIKAYPEYEKARLYLADIYFTQENFASALEQYDWLKSHGPHPSRVELYMARAAYQLHQFDRTIELLNEYLANEKISDRSRKSAETLKINAAFSKHAIANPLDFEPKHLGEAVNSVNSEYLPSLTADETTVIFTRKIRGQEDLYVTRIGENGWMKAEPIDEGTINTGHNEGAHCISADGKTLLYTICNERFTRGSCDLYISKKKKDGWSPPKNIGPPVNSVSWDSQPTLSADGKSIYFVSNRRGGYGGFDLYVTHFENDQWNEPVNLGPNINTAYDEQTPFIHFDDQTLYFSSNGHPGLGKQDIYFSRKVNGEWTKPVNMGYPINTSSVESGLNISLDGNTAYYAAVREEGLGGLDIYEFRVPDFAKPERVTYVRARIVDRESGKPVNATYSLSNLTGDNGNITGTAVDGEFLICLPSGSEYSLHIKDDGYIFESFNFSLKDTVQREAFVLDVEINPVAPGQVIVMRNVFFETDSYTLLPHSEGELLELLDLLQTYPAVRIEISGHTDNTGSREHNMTLSAQRAQSVVDYLTEHGIDPARLLARGYGPDRPVAGNETPAGRAENRRTEFTILE